MRKYCLFILSLFAFAMAHAQCIPAIDEVGPKAMTKSIAPIKAPFKMGGVARPVFANRRAEVKLKEGKKATVAIQKAIDNMSKRGGGTVTIPKGKWLTGRIELKSGVCLNIPEGAELTFSGDVKDYQPEVFTREEGVELYSTGACIYANGAHNIGVVGKGIISGPSVECELYKQNAANSLVIEKATESTALDQRRYNGIDTKDVFLPKTIAPINCKNVIIEGLTIRHTLFWNVVAQYCENVIIRGVTVESFGHGRTDGIDIDSSRDVLIEYCSLDCGDDTYTLKSGRGKDGLRVNRPTENVVIRRCLALRGAGGLVLGTESGGPGIHNVYMHDCVFKGTDQGFRFKTRRPRGGGGSNIIAERVRMDIAKEAFAVDMLGSHRWVGELADRLPKREINSLTPDFNTIRIKDVVVENCRELFNVKALPERPLRNVLIENMTAHGKKFMTMQDVSSMTIVNSDLSADNMEGSLTGCSGIMLVNTKTSAPVNWIIKDSTPVIKD